MIVSNVGSQMQIVGQEWLVRDLSPAPVALGMVARSGDPEAAGASSTVFMASGSTLLQLHSPRDLRGRVMSLATVAVGLVALVLGLVIGLSPGWRPSNVTAPAGPAQVGGLAVCSDAGSLPHTP